jgi:hypothetical protein
MALSVAKADHLFDESSGPPVAEMTGAIAAVELEIELLHQLYVHGGAVEHVSRPSSDLHQTPALVAQPLRDSPWKRVGQTEGNEVDTLSSSQCGIVPRLRIRRVSAVG